MLAVFADRVWTIGDLIDTVLPLEPNRSIRVTRNFRVIDSGKPRPNKRVFHSVLIPRRECSSAPNSQKVVDLALSPAMIFGRERINAGIDTDVANEEIGTLE